MNTTIKTTTNPFLKFSLKLNQGIPRAWIDSFDWPVQITQQGYTYGNPALWNSYQPGDKRKYLTIVGPGDSLQSPGVIAKWGGIKGYPPVVGGFGSGNKTYKG